MAVTASTRGRVRLACGGLATGRGRSETVQLVIPSAARDLLHYPGTGPRSGRAGKVPRCARDDGDTFAAVIVGDRVDRVSGWTLCGLARDAGCPLPILLVTGDEGPLAAARAEGLRVTVLGRSASAQRVARAMSALLPRPACAAIQ